MGFSSRQISSEKWGIYSETTLLATVSCQATCNTILANLKSGRRDAPTGDLNSLYQAPKLKKRVAAPIAVTERRSRRPPVSARKTRKLRIGTTTERSASQPPSSTPVDSSSQVHRQKVADLSGLSGLKNQQIRMVQATGDVSGQTLTTESAERA